MPLIWSLVECLPADYGCDAPLQTRFPLRFPAQTRLRLLPRPAALRSKDVIHGFKPEDDGDFISTIHAVFKTFSEHCVDVLRDRSLQVSGVLGFATPHLFSNVSGCRLSPSFLVATTERHDHPVPAQDIEMEIYLSLCEAVRDISGVQRHLSTLRSLRLPP